MFLFPVVVLNIYRHTQWDIMSVQDVSSDYRTLTVSVLVCTCFYLKDGERGRIYAHPNLWMHAFSLGHI